jgi:hypothetical protein
MVNLFSKIKESNLFRKFEVSELMFVEYTCMTEESLGFGRTTITSHL